MTKLVAILATGLLLLQATQSSLAAKDWWENGNFYQVYPRSFMDSDGDGVGDLKGVAQRVDYFKTLGMDGVWLSPIFKSPMADFGYDISDYYSVQPEYGSNDDLELLLERIHARGIRLILDFVPNHTSDEHDWFVRSVNNESEYRDYYIWHDGVYNAETGKREPPSNWLSQFRYSAWEWNDKRQQYYLHQFGVKQPDLNYRNPKVVQAMKDVLTYWLEKGIDGFRIDAVPFLFESPIDAATGTYPDEPIIEDTSICPDSNDWCYLQHPHTNSLAESTEMVYQWREVLEEFTRKYNSSTKILLTEAYTNFPNLMALYGDGQRKGANVPFNFEMLGELNAYSTAADFEYYVNHWLQNMPEGTYANWVLGNHDNPRLATRFGAERKDLMNIFLQTLPGIAVTYNGEEYGMEDVYVSWEDTVDPQGCNASPDTYEPYSRDEERTPFRWDDSSNAGFSKASRTWLPVGEGYEQENVAAQLKASNSHLKIFQKLVQLRNEPAFQEGDFKSLVKGNVLIYKRQAPDGSAFVTVLNLGNEAQAIDLSSTFVTLNKELQVAVASLQSAYKSGDIIDPASFVAEPNVGVVLKV